MRASLSTLALVSSIALTACSGGVGPGPLGVEERTRLCEDLCRYEVRCLGYDSSTCVDNCVPSSAWVRGDVFHHLTDCVDGATCEEAAMCGQGDGPNGEALPLPIHEKFWSTCSDAFATCDLDPTGYCDDQDITAANTELVGQLIDCLDQDCMVIVPCLNQVAASQGYSF